MKNVKDEKLEYPSPDKSDFHNEVLAQRLEKEMDQGILDNFLKPKGSFSVLAAVEKNLKKKK